MAVAVGTTAVAATAVPAMSDVQVAVGLLSGLCQFGSPASGLWVGTEELRKRRERLRRAAAPSSPALALRFLVESPELTAPH